MAYAVVQKKKKESGICHGTIPLVQLSNLPSGDDHDRVKKNENQPYQIQTINLVPF